MPNGLFADDHEKVTGLEGHVFAPYQITSAAGQGDTPETVIIGHGGSDRLAGRRTLRQFRKHRYHGIGYRGTRRVAHDALRGACGQLGMQRARKHNGPYRQQYRQGILPQTRYSHGRSFNSLQDTHNAMYIQ